MFGEIMIGLLLVVLAAAVIFVAAVLVANYSGEITLKGHSSKLVALCVIATAYYSILEIVDFVALLFIDLDGFFLRLARLAIGLSFLAGFLLFLYQVWKYRQEESEGILKQVPMLLVPVLLLLIGNVTLMLI